MRLSFQVALLGSLLFVSACTKKPGHGDKPADNTSSLDKGIGLASGDSGKGEQLAEKKSLPRSLKDDILGQWKGPLQDGSTLTLTFNEKENVAVDIWRKGGGFAIEGTVYKIDSEKNEVKIWGTNEWGGVAKPTKDGALLVSGDLKVGRVPETRLERVKK